MSIKPMTEEEWNKKWPMDKIPSAIREVAAAWGDAMVLFIKDRVKLAQDMLEATEKYRLEYAQEEAIAFAEWMAENHIWWNKTYKKWTGVESYTTSELYNLYKQTSK